AHKDFTVYQMDVKIAFLNGILKEEMYVGQPPGFVTKQYPDHVYALDKALYGLKQAPQAWYDVLSLFLIESGFQKGSIDTTLFIKKKVTPSEPIDSLSMGDEHLDTIPATESDEFIKSCVENLVPNPSESEGENGCDVPSCFTTFSNILFDADYNFESVDDQLLYDNSSPRPPKEFVFENSNAEIESFSPSSIPIEDSDSHMEEIDLSFNSDDPMLPNIKDDDNDSKGANLFLERLLHDDPIPIPDTLDFSNVVRVFLPFFTYPYSQKLEDSCQRILSSKSSFPQLQLGIQKRILKKKTKTKPKTTKPNTELKRSEKAKSFEAESQPWESQKSILGKSKVNPDKVKVKPDKVKVKPDKAKAEKEKKIQGNPQHALKDKGVIDRGCSRHMTGNMSYLSDFKELNGGYVAFGGNPKGGKNSRKGKIMTGKLDFDDVYFVKELKFNLPDENQVLLRVPRENNMYNVDSMNIVPSGDLTYLFAKVTLDESNLWHKRLGHINFKTMNKLVKGNLVRGLPSKVFENDYTCVACKKGKQHRASCKTKTVSSVNQPLQRLHMDLFGRTFVKSLNKKSYFLVVTDDYSRFTWVFFLATKDETSPILKTFIIGLENQLSLKVKIIRSDNGTEFKNNDLTQFYGMKGIKREFSVPRTPQRNGITERKNRILIEAARTMLVDSLLPILFWAEAVNIACKFDGKVDEGFLVGYSVNSKAFRVFNCGTRIVQETLHIHFLEKNPNVAGRGPTWLFDIDTLTQTMNYQLVTAGNQSNPSAGVQEQFDAKKAGEENVQQYVIFLSAQSKKHDDKTKREDKGKSHVDINEDNAAGTLVLAVRQLYPNSTNTFSAAGPSNATAKLEDITYSDGAEADFNNLETSIKVSPISTTRVHKDHHVTQIIGDLSSATQTRSMTRVAKDQGGLSQINNDNFHTCMFACFLSQEEPKRVHQALKDPSWIEVMQEELLQFKMQKEEGIDYEEVFAPAARIEAIRLFLAYASFMGFMVYQMDVKIAFRYETIEEEVYVCQPLGFKDPDYLDKVYKVVKALYGLHQAPRA
nr:hypothetical protein [Tanacetum cinerariifolium]